MNTKTDDEAVKHYQAVVSKAGQSKLGTFLVLKQLNKLLMSVC
jgi:hypothetical protein